MGGSRKFNNKAEKIVGSHISPRLDSRHNGTRQGPNRFKTGFLRLDSTHSLLDWIFSNDVSDII